MTHIRVSTRALIIRDEKVLLVEFNDEYGLHYNLPGGGVQPGESLQEGLVREVLEETSTHIDVGDLLLITEYEPVRNKYWAGETHSLSFLFHCQIKGNSEPSFPDTPDPNQTSVKWIRLQDLDSIELLPHIAPHIVQIAAGESPDQILLSEPINPERAMTYLSVNDDDLRVSN